MNAFDGLWKVSTAFTVNVADANDNAPVFEADIWHISASRRLQIGEVVGRTVAHDPDVGDNAAITYSLVRDSHYVRIDPSTGHLISLVDLVQVTDADVSIEVVARDNGIPQQSSSVACTIHIVSSDNSPPKFISSRRAFAISSSVTTTVVAQFAATDIDDGWNGKVTVWIGQGPFHPTFDTDCLSLGSCQ